MVKPTSIPQQGDIIKINLDPKQGHEQQGYRPTMELYREGWERSITRALTKGYSCFPVQQLG